MKFSIKLCALLLALLTASAATAGAASYITLNGFAFDLNSDGEAVIHSYDNRSAEVSIPDKLLGANVIAIDDYAFYDDGDITSLSFENAVNLKSIGVSAFYGCSGIKRLELPDGITSLGFGAFQGCSSVERLTLPNNITEIPGQSFYKCPSLDGVTIPGSVKTIGEFAFGGCGSLTAVEIPDSVTSIADNAFKDCDKLAVFCNENSYAESYALSHDIPCYRIKEYAKGDSNMDGDVNILDVTAIQKYRVGKYALRLFRNKYAADANGDGSVTVRDATMIQMYIAKIIDKL